MGKLPYLIIALAGSVFAFAEDARLHPPMDLNTPRTFPKIESKEQWQTRAREIREQILVSCGLWPVPPKTALNAKIFDRKERQGYSVEKVYFETYPGFFLGGNLYRPLNKGSGPFPGVLNPHGHWKNGRMADEESGSIAGRCINFARQGMVAFSYDMVGYNDTHQVGHRFASNPTNQLWNISLMGLQTWNSIRALDFLESLAEVDKTRLACTGESGGGTQTFMLGAVDDRLAAQAPIVMVSHAMQGGCWCENAAGLRVKYSNMEIAAQPAPRIQMFVAATGDWTADTMDVEGPSVASIYELFGGRDRLRYVLFDYGHNYNKTSREAVYEWFGKWLLHEEDESKLKETSFQKEPDEALRIWPDETLPEGALKEPELIAAMIERSRNQLNELAPKDGRSLEKFQEILLTAWRHNMELDSVAAEEVQAARQEPSENGDGKTTRLLLTNRSTGQELPAIFLEPMGKKKAIVAILVHPDGKRGLLEHNGSATLAQRFLEGGISVLAPDLFLTGDLDRPELRIKRDYFKNHFTTYNKTDLQERVQDIATACAYARKLAPDSHVVLWGVRRGGLWAMAAAPLADGVVADAAQVDPESDQELLAEDLFAPGLRKLGGFAGILVLAGTHPVLVHNAGSTLHFIYLRDCYNKCRKAHLVRLEPGKLDAEAGISWISGNVESGPN